MYRQRKETVIVLIRGDSWCTADGVGTVCLLVIRGSNWCNTRKEETVVYYDNKKWTQLVHY